MKDWIEGEHYYLDERGMLVFTEKYHLERGYCCGNGCRHCPFNFDNENYGKEENKNGKAQTDSSFGEAG